MQALFENYLAVLLAAGTAGFGGELDGVMDLDRLGGIVTKAVSLEPMHGWGISQRLQQFSKGVLEVNQGSLYPALHRLVKRRWLDASWGTSENNRRARFYRLTAAGKKQLVGALGDRVVGGEVGLEPVHGARGERKPHLEAQTARDHALVTQVAEALV